MSKHSKQLKRFLLLSPDRGDCSRLSFELAGLLGESGDSRILFLFVGVLGVSKRKKGGNKKSAWR